MKVNKYWKLKIAIKLSIMNLLNLDKNELL
jgi:hypothetical protein